MAFLRGRLARYVAALVAALAVAVVPFMTDDRFVLKVLTFVGVNVIIVVGLALLFGYAGQISLGHAAFVGIGAYASGFATVKLQWPWPAGVALAVVVAAAGGLLLALPSLRLRGHYLAMATLAFGEIMTVFFVEAKDVTGGTDGLSGIPYPQLGALKLSTAPELYLLVWGVAGLVLLLVANVVRSRPGLALRALREAPLGAQACGVDVTRFKVAAFTISAGLGGLAGALYAHVVGFISPTTFSLAFSVTLVAMVVVGGTRSLIGPLLATVLLTLLPYPDVWAPSLGNEAQAVLKDWSQDVYALALILVMLFAPEGLAGAVRAVRERRQRRGGAGDAVAIAEGSEAA